MGAGYAVIRNGMWDDPAEAVTGSIAKKFEKQAASNNYSSKFVATYLTWRFCYMLCGLFLSVARLAVSLPLYSQVRAEFQAFLAQLPSQVSPERFGTLVSFLAGYEVFNWVLVVLTTLLLACGIFTALPSTALGRVRCSRRLVWAAWLTSFLPPFAITLIFPARSLVPWDEVIADVCEASMKQTFNMPGSNLQQQLLLMQREGMLEGHAINGLSKGVKPWCVKQGATWDEEFFGSAVKCSWYLDDVCRQRVCVGNDPNSPAAGSRLQSCLSNCVEFALTTSTSNTAAKVTALHNQIRACLDSGGPDADSRALAARMPTLPQRPTAASFAELYDFSANMQQKAVEGMAVGATAMSLQAEYVVGMLIGVALGRALLSASLSVLGGMAEGLLNVKALFPAMQGPAWILMLTTLEALPIYAALFGVFNQFLGDGALAVACISAVAYLSLGTLTGHRLKWTGHGDEQRQRVYMTVWLEYGLRALLGACIVASCAVWILRRDQWGVKEYIRDDLLTPNVIIAWLLDFLSKKIITAVASTDALINAFVQSEQWQMQALQGPAKDDFMGTLNDLSRVGSVKPDKVEAIDA
mmetsp:Transcript_96785/g.312550  ORF Transcript_96785/g.312550 Transcript_96785/m.312550 type:complete len:582 (-) Transcript_96785:607-2352(-)